MTRSGPSGERPGDPGLAELVGRTEGLQPWRRLFHAASGVAMVAGLLVLPLSRGLVLALLGSCVVILWLADLARLSSPRLNVLFFRAFPSLASPREAEKPASSSWYVLGIFLALLLFSRERAVAGILVLALADPAASLVGRRWGRRPVGNGSLEGSATFFGVACLALLTLVPPGPALAAAALATVVEVLPWPLDDNLTIPLVTAGALQLLAVAWP